MEVYVIRHTAVDVPKDVCYGQMDVPLKSTFEEEVQAYKQSLPEGFDAVFSSPALRCMKLSNVLPFDDIKTDKRLLEINFGKWEGKKWSEIDQEELNPWMDDFVHEPTAEGESLSEMYERVFSFLEELRNKDFEKVLIVAHSGVIRCLWAALLSLPLKNIFKIPVGFGETLIFNLGKEKDYDRIIQTK
ncbi:alpha-ribazole phosphatase [Flammeovirga aprica]|uniref:Alpha-ribazole phosphatase n=1 Tax=Flammeovirga aprica JL-4 TaxID=694437 RepID=A0A7X9S100_9BACT|nr:alpha-ribazole phosphatase [Flammeovirga aprica]NME72437.1 alpha-ribazole phosphatase [Flammeovirga aprica JL-4]